MIPYGRQWIDDEDIQAVVEALKSDWLTTGPMVEVFEKRVSAFVGAGHGVAVSNGTAALHAAMHAIGIGPGDEVIVPCMTFAATANAVVFQGGTPVFCDVLADTLLIDPDQAARKITSRTKAIVAVDYAGQPCDYEKLNELAKAHGLIIIADACHSIGATYRGKRVGSVADLTAFSFHPVKHITTGEGGMVCTDNAEWALRMRRFRNHGISSDHRQREKEKAWFYAMEELGFNYRITDFQCALGASQLKKLPAWLQRRNAIAAIYAKAFEDHRLLRPLSVGASIAHAYHLYVVRLNVARLKKSRHDVFQELRAMGIGVNVHYIPVHLHPFYKERFGTVPGLCPIAEAAYEEILSLPLFPAMKDSDIECVIASVEKAL